MHSIDAFANKLATNFADNLGYAGVSNASHTHILGKDKAMADKLLHIQYDSKYITDRTLILLNQQIEIH